MKRLLFFVNPNAGHTEIRSSLMQVIQIFTAGGYEVTVHPTAGPRDLTRQIVERGADYDLIVCAGPNRNAESERVTFCFVSLMRKNCIR